MNYTSSNAIYALPLELKDWGRIMSLGKQVAENVKALRLARGLSQQQLAIKTELTVRYISRLENTAPNITLDVLERLMMGLGCSASEILGEIKDKTNSKSSVEALDQTIRFLESLRSRL